MVSSSLRSMRILIVSRSAPDLHNGSGLHMEDFVHALELQGCEIHYLALCRTAGGPPRSRIHRVRFQEGPVQKDWDASAQEWEIRTVDRICREIVPGVVIADYSWMGPIFDASYFREQDSVRRLIFIHDLRIRIMPSYVKMGFVRAEHNSWTDAREAAYLARGQVLLTLNEQDQRKAQELSPAARVLRMAMSVPSVPTDEGAAVSGRCLYGAAGLNENLYAAVWLLKFAWPRVGAAHPSASLVICGGVGDMVKSLGAAEGDWLAELDRLNVWLEGRVETLAPYYASAQIALVPHWMDGGIKIKHIEALSHGLAVVCTPAGADGLPEAVGRSAF